MFKYEIELNYFNLRTNSNFRETHSILTNEQLVFVDLLGDVCFAFNNKEFNDFCNDMNTNVHLHFGKKLKASIKRRLKGTSKGVQVVYRDEDNLIWHVFVTIVEIFN